MARNRKELELEIAKNSSAADRLRGDLQKLTSQEAAAISDLSESLIAGQGDQSGSKLAELRSRKDALTAALDLAGQRISLAREELASLERAELAGQWTGIEAEMRASLGKIQKLAGESGLKGELDRLLEIMQRGERVSSVSSQEAAILVSQIRGFWTTSTNSLFAIWDSAARIENHSHAAAVDSDGCIRGFGKKP